MFQKHFDHNHHHSQQIDKSNVCAHASRYALMQQERTKKRDRILLIEVPLNTGKVYSNRVVKFPED